MFCADDLSSYYEALFLSLDPSARRDEAQLLRDSGPGKTDQADLQRPGGSVSMEALHKRKNSEITCLTSLF